MPILPTLERPPLLREQVYETLRRVIQRGDLSQDEPLSEANLAAELGVSRTPVREALQRLELEGFVVRAGDGSLYPADLSLEQLIEVHEIRGLLESYAARQAAERLSEQEIRALEAIHREELDELAPMIRRVHNSELPVELAQRVAELNHRFHAALVGASHSQTLLRFFNLYDVHLLTAVFVVADPSDTLAFIEDHGRILEAVIRGDGERAAELTQLHLERAIRVAREQADRENAAAERR